MKYLKFLISLVLLIGIFFVLNTKFEAVPALGEFLNPAQGIWQNEKTEATIGNVQMDGLSAKVTIHYDEELVPHIFRSEEHTSELQSRPHLVCRLLLEKKKKKHKSVSVL